ncbi:MAG: hypothetical protein M3R08_12115 [Bacteroidota bacterium]|nr:hypothetical protein [Bacteroidota bacterium]
MSIMHPITKVAERLGRVSSRFEPGTDFYEDVVQQTRNSIDQANDRDDLELVVETLEKKLTAHLTDDEMKTFQDIVNDIREMNGPWPVEAFKEGYQRGTGQQLPDDGSAAGRKLNPDRIDEE